MVISASADRDRRRFLHHEPIDFEIAMLPAGFETGFVGEVSPSCVCPIIILPQAPLEGLAVAVPVFAATSGTGGSTRRGSAAFNPVCFA